jgi:hypothetical protein
MAYEGIITRQLRELRERVEKLEHALMTLASWHEGGEWSGAKEYISAMLDMVDTPPTEGEK